MHPTKRSGSGIAGWPRRPLIHRVDAEQSSGTMSGVDEELAGDGVDEIIAVMLPGLPDWASFDGTGQTVCLSIPGRSWSLEEGWFSGISPATGNTYEDLLAFEIAAPRRTSPLRSREAPRPWTSGYGAGAPSTS